MNKRKLITMAVFTVSMIFAMATQVYTATSTGTVGFKSVTDITNPPIDPENPDPDPGDEKPDVPGTGDKGEVTLDYVPTINFGENLDVYSTQHTYPQQIKSTKLGVGGLYDAPFIQVSEKRGADKRTGWTVQVDIGPFYKTGDNTKMIKGAQIVFGKGRVNSSSTSIPAVAAGGTINANTTPSPLNIFLSGENGQGEFSFGTWVSRLYTDVVEGDNYNKVYDPPVLDEGVQLIVPGGSANPGDTYQATMTWTLLNTM